MRVRALRTLLIALVATVVAVTVGVLVVGGDEPAPVPPAAAPPPATLSSLDTTELLVARTDFCTTVPEDAVADAVAGPVDEVVAYGNGRRARIVGSLRDVAHEFSCAWSAADGTVARAWVFAPPVTSERATALAGSARRDAGCEPLAGAPSYGVPSVALECTEGGSRRQSFRGLFGDAWLTCQLTAPAAVPAAELTERTSRWCAAVVQSAAPLD